MGAEQDDPVMVRIGAAVERGRAGDRAQARRLLDGIWEAVGPGGNALHRCAVAHHAADVQEDPADELRWDLRALEAADELSAERAHHPGVDVAGFYPSLHLNLADAHRRVGDVEGAARHLADARAALGALVDGEYSRMIVDGIDRCAARLATGDAG